MILFPMGTACAVMIRTSTFAYDSRGRRTSATDQNGKTTNYAYDDADRLTSVTDAASHVTYYAYDTERVARALQLNLGCPVLRIL